MTVSTSTITGNRAVTFAGGGIAVDNAAVLNLNASSITGNESGEPGGGIDAKTGAIVNHGGNNNVTDNTSAGQVDNCNPDGRIPECI